MVPSVDTILLRAPSHILLWLTIVTSKPMAACLSGYSISMLNLEDVIHKDRAYCGNTLKDSFWYVR